MLGLFQAATNRVELYSNLEQITFLLAFSRETRVSIMCVSTVICVVVGIVYWQAVWEKEQIFKHQEKSMNLATTAVDVKHRGILSTMDIRSMIQSSIRDSICTSMKIPLDKHRAQCQALEDRISDLHAAQKMYTAAQLRLREERILWQENIQARGLGQRRTYQRGNGPRSAS